MKRKEKKIKFRIPIAPVSDIVHKQKKKYNRKPKHRGMKYDRQDQDS